MATSFWPDFPCLFTLRRTSRKFHPGASFGKAARWTPPMDSKGETIGLRGNWQIGRGNRLPGNDRPKGLFLRHRRATFGQVLFAQMFLHAPPPRLHERII